MTFVEVPVVAFEVDAVPVATLEVTVVAFEWADLLFEVVVVAF